MNLFDAFQTAAEAHPSKPAIFWGDQTTTYGQLLEQTAAVATGLTRETGITPGARVGIWLRNCPEFVAVLYGILRAGAVAVPINCFLKPAEVAFIAGDAGVDCVIADPAFATSAAELLPEASPGFPRLKPLVIAGSTNPLCVIQFPPAPAGSPAGADLAVIIYTSGTTGRAKGAMLSHANLLSNIASCKQVLAAVSDDRFAVLLPLFHSFMLTVGTLLPLSVGASMVLIKSLHPAKQVLQEIITHQATLLPAIPQFFRMMAEAAALPPLPLRLCISGAAPLPVQVLRDFSAKVSVPLLEGYGLSEASPVVTMNPLPGPWKAGSIGLPIPGVEVTVQDDAGNMLATGLTGEICVRGPNVMQGYWNQPEETRKVMRNGWLLTGDIGCRDVDGYFYITDRKKDMLLVNGINVYPREVEEVIYQFTGVREAAVIGVPDRRKGEQPLAFVALEAGTLDERALLQFLRSRLADYKIPRRIVQLDKLPRNATGKVLKTELRQQAGINFSQNEPAPHGRDTR